MTAPAIIPAAGHVRAAIRRVSFRASFVVLCVMVLCVPMVPLARNSFAAGGSSRIEADTVSSWDYNCRKSRLEQLRSLRLQC